MADMKTQDNVFPFLCENSECKHEYDLEGFMNVVLFWGLIFQTSDKYSILGITCPECNKTTLKKYPFSATYALRETLENNSAHIKYVIPFSLKILRSQSLIENKRDDTNGKLKNSYRIPFGFTLYGGYSDLISEEFPYFIDEEIIPKLIEIENDNQFKVFPRIVSIRSVYLFHDPVFMNVDGSKEIPYEIVDHINETYLVTLGSGYNPIADNNYGHLIKNNMKPDEPLVVNPGTWTKKLTQNVARFVRHYQKKRNRIDFELIYQNDFFNRYARIFYSDPVEWNRQKCEEEALLNIQSDQFSEDTSERNSTENIFGNDIEPEKAQALFPSYFSSAQPPNQKSTRTSTKVKIACQKKATELWGKAKINGTYILSTGEMAKHREINEIGGAYTKAQRQRWLSQVAPEEAKKPGVRPKNRM